MTQTLINTVKRDASLNPRQVRSQGLLPATLYGKGMDSISIQIDLNDFVKAYKKDKNAIFELQVDGTTYKAIVKKVQSEAVSDKVLNVEFQNIVADQKVKVFVPISTTGDSAAVKAGGQLNITISKLKVECLPSDIPSSVKVNIAALAGYDDVITVKQIEFPETVKPLGSLDSIVVKINAPKASKS